MLTLLTIRGNNHTCCLASLQHNINGSCFLVLTKGENVSCQYIDSTCMILLIGFQIVKLCRSYATKLLKIIVICNFLSHTLHS